MTSFILKDGTKVKLERMISWEEGIFPSRKVEPWDVVRVTLYKDGLYIAHVLERNSIKRQFRKLFYIANKKLKEKQNAKQ